MRPRFDLILAFIALFGIVPTHSTLVIDLMNLIEEQKTGPVPVKLHGRVRLKCGKIELPKQWVRIRELDVTFYNLTSSPHEIQKFTMRDNGNYQCRVETDEYRRYSNVVLCEAADDFLKCKTEGQTYRHLIKYGPPDRKKQAWKNQEEIRFDHLGLGDSTHSTETSEQVSMESDFKLVCGNVTIEIVAFYWFVTWKSKWFDLGEYAQSSSEPAILMPLHRGKYQCVIESVGRLTVRRTFHVTFKDELLPPSYEGEPMRELGGSMHDNLTVNCDIQIQASENITWVKSDECPNTETKIYERKILRDPEQTNNRLGARDYQITELSSKDEGCYTCFVSRRDKTYFQSRRLKILQGDRGIPRPATELPRPPAALDDKLGAFPVELTVSISCIVVLLLVVIAATIYYLRRSKRGPRRRLCPFLRSKKAIDLKSCCATDPVPDDQELLQSFKIRSKADSEILEIVDHEIHQNAKYSPWEVGPDNLKLDDILSQHDFHTLYRARLVDVLPGKSINGVVKMSNGTTDIDVLTLVSEMEIMKSIGRHPNVVGLLGTCTRTDALFFVMEFVEHGNLRDYLRERGSSLGYEYINESESESERLSVHIDLVAYARQVAMGMEYLASQRCVHRDLRAKRVLIGEGGILKIADYATKRIRREDLHAATQDNNMLSVRWMAPETLFRGVHNTEANVWSYGILLWEIMTFAETPYPLILTNDELIGRLKLGYYMENPNCCPDDIYKLMRRCWNKNPGKRPRFDQLVEDLSGMLKNLSDQLERLETEDDEQAIYANTISDSSCQRNYDCEYADVRLAIGDRITPAKPDDESRAASPEDKSQCIH